MPPTYFPLRWESAGEQWWFASPIDWAAANGHYDLFRELLHLDGNHLITLTSLRRIRRLETVWDDEEQFDDVAKCRSQVARKLLSECEIKKGKNSLVRGGYGGWLLYTAASAGDLGFVQELLGRDPLLVFGEGEYGVTDMLYAASRSKNSEVFRFIFDFAVSPRFPASNGRDFEERIGEIPSAYKQEMLNRGIHAAARGGNMEILKELVGDCTDALAHRDSYGSTVLHAAAARGQVEVVKDLVARFDIVESLDNSGNSALHVAADRGQLAVVDALILACPSSIHLKNNCGETLLHKAVSGFQTHNFRRLDHQIDLMKQLICGKMFDIEEIVNEKDKNGRTALHLAIMENIHSDLVELLMTVPSLDVNIRDSDGMTPLDILRRRPSSASSDVLTRQLISAGGIFGSQDCYSSRRAIVSRLKRLSIGSSPGTSFGVSDLEIFLHTGIENASDASGSAAMSTDCSAEPSEYDSTMENQTPRRFKNMGGSVNYAAQRLKRLLHWPKMKESKADRHKKLADMTETPVPLRQRFSKPSSLANNKRTLSVRSSIPSPNAKKKLASGLVQGVMQAMPQAALPRQSLSGSFSKSSHSSLDKQKGVYIEEEEEDNAAAAAAAPSSSSGQVWTQNSIHKQGSVNKTSMSRYLCFNVSVKQPPDRGLASRRQQHDAYERSVLSVT